MEDVVGIENFADHVAQAAYFYADPNAALNAVMTIHNDGEDDERGEMPHAVILKLNKKEMKMVKAARKLVAQGANSVALEAVGMAVFVDENGKQCDTPFTHKIAVYSTTMCVTAESQDDNEDRFISSDLSIESYDLKNEIDFTWDVDYVMMLAGAHNVTKATAQAIIKVVFETTFKTGNVANDKICQALDASNFHGMSDEYLDIANALGVTQLSSPSVIKKGTAFGYKMPLDSEIFFAAIKKGVKADQDTIEEFIAAVHVYLDDNSLTFDDAIDEVLSNGDY